MPKEAERPTRFAVDVSKRASKCNKCRSPIEKGTVRMAKIIPNYFYKGEGEVPDMKQYHHINCLFEVLYKARATTKVIDDVDDIEGWDEIDDEHKQTITSLVEDLQEHRKKLAEDGSPKKPQRKRKAKSEEDDESGEESADEKKKSTKKDQSNKKKVKVEDEEDVKPPKKQKGKDGEKRKAKKKPDPNANPEESKYNMFYKFCQLCDKIGAVSKKEEKSTVIRKLLQEDEYDGDTALIFSMLISGEKDERDYSLDSKQLIVNFCEMYEWGNPDKMFKTMEEKKKDTAEVIHDKFLKENLEQTKKSDWSIQKIHRWLDKLPELSKNSEKCQAHFKFVAKRVSAKELLYLIRLVQKDLKVGATSGIVLGSLKDGALKAYEKGENLNAIIETYDPAEREVESGSEKGSSGDEEEGDENSHPQKPSAKKAKKDVKSSAKKGKDKSTKKAVDKKKKVAKSSDDESDADSFIGDEEMDSGGEESEEEEELDELSDEDESELDSSVLDESSSDEDNSSDESSGDEDGYAAAAKQGPSTSRTSNRPQRRKNKTGSQGDDDGSKKARVPCKYGEACYRKNAQHKANFWHPDEDKEKKGKAKADKQNGQQDEQDNE